MEVRKRQRTAPAAGLGPTKILRSTLEKCRNGLACLATRVSGARRPRPDLPPSAAAAPQARDRSYRAAPAAHARQDERREPRARTAGRAPACRPRAAGPASRRRSVRASAAPPARTVPARGHARAGRARARPRARQPAARPPSPKRRPGSGARARAGRPHTDDPDSSTNICSCKTPRAATSGDQKSCTAA